MKKFSWHKIYIFVTLLVAVAFLGFNILADVEETALVLKEYIAGQDCPKFVSVNELTMRDDCTGLVWARNELPTYYNTFENFQTTDNEPGYTWQEAMDGCVALSPAGMFRLPTVEELISLVKYQCSSGNCRAQLDSYTLDSLPAFALGIYWSSNDFNETADWTAGSPQRDYKRSVNLLTGEIDNPVFSLETRLNAWCIVDRTPEIVEKKFISTNLSPITNGQALSGGVLKTTYNRKCETGCDAIEAVCDSDRGFCAKEETITIPPRIADCNSGYHAEHSGCRSNTEISYTYPDGGSFSGAWVGNKFNGYWFGERLYDNDDDGIDNTVDNCPEIANPDQADVDNDGIGDFCDDCYDYNGQCIELKVEQAATGFSATFNPYAVGKTSSEFYNYSTTTSSGVIEDYPIVLSDRSEVFAYINVNTNMMSLGFIHDIPNDGSGGKVEWVFSGNGWDMATITVTDDNDSEFRKTAVPHGKWSWNPCCTDGGMMDIANLDTGWKVTITPSLFQSITEWFVKEPGYDGVYDGVAVPSLTDPIIISYCPPGQNCLVQCGNGVLEEGEECDDGNTSNNDDCLNSCEFARCGDGYVWNIGGGTEECDDGNLVTGDYCDSSCKIYCVANITADNCYDLYINNSIVGQAPGFNPTTGSCDTGISPAFDWTTIETWVIRDMLVAGENIISVKAVDNGDEQSFSGVKVKSRGIMSLFGCGKETGKDEQGKSIYAWEQFAISLPGGANNWKCDHFDVNQNEPSGWRTLTFNDSSWEAPIEITDARPESWVPLLGTKWIWPDSNEKKALCRYKYTFESCFDGVQNQGEQGVDCGGPCPKECLPIKKVFVTTGSWNGILGGLSGADNKCQTEANLAGLAGTYKAWLSDMTISAASRLTHHNGPYVLVDGTKIADNWDDLTDGTLDYPIRKTANNIEQTIGLIVWTGSNADGSIGQYNCANWSSTMQFLPGTTTTINTTVTVSDYFCVGALKLYCLEQ